MSRRRQLSFDTAHNRGKHGSDLSLIAEENPAHSSFTQQLLLYSFSRVSSDLRPNLSVWPPSKNGSFGAYLSNFACRSSSLWAWRTGRKQESIIIHGPNFSANKQTGGACESRSHGIPR